jgi:hypothetical protein
MSAPPKNVTLCFIVAGLLMISIFFLTSSPLTLSNLVLGVVPLVFLAVFGITLLRAKKSEKGGSGG